MNALVRQSRLSVPQLDCLVVILIDRRPKTFFGEAVPAIGHRTGQELPCERDRTGFEIVTEREVTCHLKERRVAGRTTHLLDIKRADNFLNAGRARIGRRRLAQEVRLERHHASVDEEQRGVIKKQGCRRNHLMASFAEEHQEATADLS